MISDQLEIFQELLEKGAKVEVAGYDRLHATTPPLAALTSNVMGAWGRNGRDTCDNRMEIVKLLTDEGWLFYILSIVGPMASWKTEKTWKAEEHLPVREKSGNIYQKYWKIRKF